MCFSWVFLFLFLFWKQRVRIRSLRGAHEGEQSQKRMLWRRLDAEGVDKRVKNKRFPAEEMDCSLFLSAYPQCLGCKDCLKAKRRNARKGRNSCCWVHEKTLKDDGGKICASACHIAAKPVFKKLLPTCFNFLRSFLLLRLRLLCYHLGGLV